MNRCRHAPGVHCEFGAAGDAGPEPWKERGQVPDCQDGDCGGGIRTRGNGPGHRSNVGPSGRPRVSVYVGGHHILAGAYGLRRRVGLHLSHGRLRQKIR